MQTLTIMTGPWKVDKRITNTHKSNLVNELKLTIVYIKTWYKENVNI